MATDLGRGRVVLFGGDDGTGAPRGDTWEWNGSTWLQRSPPQSPPGREGHAMAYDPGRARTVLFGGGDVLLPPTLGDCWEWDGTTWLQVTGSLPPSRTSHSLVFDTARNRILLLGGQFLIAAAFGAPRNDLWEWDGVVWTPRTVAGVVPAARRTTVAAHDAGLARTFVFSGEAEADSWLLGPVSAARVVAYGNACAGSFGVPELHAKGEPFVGNAWFGLQGTALVPGALGFVGISTLQANVPLASGCTALVDQPSWFRTTADARGVIDLRMPIPNLASLHGVIAFAQAVAFDPNGSLAGFLALSAGLRATLD